MDDSITEAVGTHSTPTLRKKRSASPRKSRRTKQPATEAGQHWLVYRLRNRPLNMASTASTMKM